MIPPFRNSLHFPASARSAAGHCLVIGEVAQAHDGSVGIAHAFIDAIAEAGADAVKFQTHIATAESTPEETWRVQFSPQDASRYAYWKRMEFTEEQWHGLKKHADDRGLLFLSSPFSLEAVDLLNRVGVAAWKVASGEVAYEPMFERMLQTRLPFLISSGMSPLAEIDAVMARVKAEGIPGCVLQCTSAYPCLPEKIGLNLIPRFRERYGHAGLSDHSGTIFPSLAAVGLGAEVMEVHVTLSREMFGPDVVASVTTAELRQLVAGVRCLEKALTHPVDKDAAAREMKPLRDLFTKSLVLKSDLPAGAVLHASHLAFKKPGTGIPASQAQHFIGRQLARAVSADTLLSENDFI